MRFRACGELDSCLCAPPSAGVGRDSLQPARRRAPARISSRPSAANNGSPSATLQHDEYAVAVSGGTFPVEVVAHGHGRTDWPSASSVDGRPCRRRRTRRRSATWTSPRRSPSTSQRRSPPSNMTSTIAQSRHVGSAPTNVSTSSGDRIVGSVRGTSTSGTVREVADPPGRRVVTAWHRAHRHRRVTAGDEIGVAARHRRQPPADCPRRQTRLPITDAHHFAVTALGGQELEHIRRRRRQGIPPDDREERLQDEAVPRQRVRPAPTRDELEIAVDEQITERVVGLARRRHRPDHERGSAQPPTLPGTPPPPADAPKITRVLGDMARRSS